MHCVEVRSSVLPHSIKWLPIRMTLAVCWCLWLYSPNCIIPHYHYLPVKVSRATNLSRCSFSFSAPTIWNEFPAALTESNTLDVFKHRLKHTLPLYSPPMYNHLCSDVVFPRKYYVENFLENFRKFSTAENMWTSNTDRSRTVTLIAPTIDISPEKAALTTQQYMQNVIKIKLKSNKMKNCMTVLQINAGKNCSVQLKLPQALGSTNNADQCPHEMLK